jgi:hypothetical protein
VATALARIDDLAKAHIDTQSKVGIALRFVDWYSRKGEAFQAVADVVEQHMDKLAGLGEVSAVFPSGGSPFQPPAAPMGSPGLAFRAVPLSSAGLGLGSSGVSATASVPGAGPTTGSTSTTGRGVTPAATPVMHRAAGGAHRGSLNPSSFTPFPGPSIFGPGVGSAAPPATTPHMVRPGWP